MGEPILRARRRVDHEGHSRKADPVGPAFLHFGVGTRFVKSCEMLPRWRKSISQTHQRTSRKCPIWKHLRLVKSARTTGLEPATTGSTVRNPDAANTQPDSELGQTPIPEVPTGVPCPPETPSGPEIPADLARVINAWKRLPEGIRTGILALVDAAGGTRGYIAPARGQDRPRLRTLRRSGHVGQGVRTAGCRDRGPTPNRYSRPHVSPETVQEGRVPPGTFVNSTTQGTVELGGRVCFTLSYRHLGWQRHHLE